MDGNNQSMMVNGENPDMLWLQHIDYLATQSKIMKKEYSRRKRANKPFTWNDLDVMNKKDTSRFRRCNEWRRKCTRE